MSETVLARAIHLLTLSAYAWNDGEVGGNERGSIFFNSAAIPTQESWVNAVLLANPSEVMHCNLYEGEPNMLQLLKRLAVEGDTDMSCTQDNSIRSGAAWLCQYSTKESKRAAALLNKPVNSLQRGESNSPENEKKRRSREARERIMKKMNEKMVKFMQSVEGHDEASQASNSHFENSNDFTNEKAPSSHLHNSGALIIEHNNDTLGEAGNVIDVNIRLLDMRPRCFICAEDGDFATNLDDTVEQKTSEKVIAFCAFAQASTVLKGGDRIPNPKNFNELSNFVGTHVSLCGHAVHTSCIESHLNDVQDFRRNEFKCPVCRRLSNCLVPFIDVGSDWIQSSQQMFDMTKKMGNKESSTSSFFQEKKNSNLHNFLAESKWWAAQNDSDLIWDGRSAFINLDSTEHVTSDDERVTTNSYDSNRPTRGKRQSFLGKKGLYKAWSSAMWTPSCVRCPVKGRNLGITTSTTVTDVWRRFMDQVAELSYKVDLKRLGQQNLTLNFGEFRQYYADKYSYSGEALAPGPGYRNVSDKL